jgi:hypothetical protein
LRDVTSNSHVVIRLIVINVIFVALMLRAQWLERIRPTRSFAIASATSIPKQARSCPWKPL